MENQTSAAVPALMKRAIFAEIAALQTDGNGVFDAQSWADFGALGSRLTKAGVAWKTCELGSNFTAFMEAAFRDEAERGEIVFRLNKAGAHPNSRVRLTKAPAKKAAAVAPSNVPTQAPTVAVKTAIPASPVVSVAKSGATAQTPPQLSDAEVEKRVLATIGELQTDADGKRDASRWVRFANLGARLKEKGVDGKTAGFSTFAKFFETRFAEKLEFNGDSNARQTRPKTASPAVVPVAQAPSTASTVATVAEKTPVAASVAANASASAAPKKETAAVVPVAKSVSTAQTSPKLSDAELEKRVFATLRALQKDDAGRRDPAKWGDFTVLGPRLKAVGVDCKAFGCRSYVKLLEARFPETLQFDKNEPTAWRVRPTLAPNQNDAELAGWAVVAPECFDELAELALPENGGSTTRNRRRASRVFRF